MSVRNTVMREQIANAAARLFQTRGINGVTMQEVAQEVNLSKAALYHYFAGRDDLLRHLFGDWARKELDSARAIVESESGPATKLTEFISMHLRAIADNLDLYSLSFREEEQLPSDVRDEFRGLKHENDLVVRQIIREGVETGVFEPVNETLTVFAIVGMCNWLWKWYRPTGNQKPDEIAETFSHLVLRGLMSGDPEQGNIGEGPAGAAAFHARAIRHHSRQLEALLPGLAETGSRVD
jgi:AcrR family transcriptional regulator